MGDKCIAMPIFEQLQTFVKGRKLDSHPASMACRHHSGKQSAGTTTQLDAEKNKGVRESEALNQNDLVDMSKLTPQHAGSALQAPDAVLMKRVQHLEEQELKYKELQKDCEELDKECYRLREERNDFRQRLRHVQKSKEQLKLQSNECEHHLNHISANYEHLVRNAVVPFANARGIQWNDQTREMMALVLDPLTADAIEASELRSQVAALQQEMLAKRDKVPVVSDDQVAQDFRNLAALIRGVSRTVQPMQGVNMLDYTGSFGLLLGVDQQPWGSRAGKKFLIEAWVWSVLYDYVFSKPFGWFGIEGLDLTAMWACIFGSDYVGGWPVPSPLSETWRSTTSAQLDTILNPETLAERSWGTKSLGGSFRNVDFSVINHRGFVYSTIMSCLCTISGTQEIPQVQSIVDKAFAFAFQMSLQRVRLQVTYPCAGAAFDPVSMNAMHDPNDEDEDEDEEVKNGVVTFVLNPGLSKWGNAHGKNLDQRLDIVPSTVKVEEVGTREGTVLL